MTEQWNTERVRVELRLGSLRATAAQLARWGIRPAAREPGRSGMNLYDAEEIRSAIAARPGRGRRDRIERPFTVQKQTENNR